MDIIKGSKAGKSDEPIEVLDICGTASSGMSWLQNFFRDLSRQPVTKQVLIGGASGWIVGYISMKVGKAAATLLGGSLIVMQLAAHKGYIKVDWSRVNKDLERSAKKIKSEVKKNVGTNLTNDVRLKRKGRSFEKQLENVAIKMDRKLDSLEAKADSWFSQKSRAVNRFYHRYILGDEDQVSIDSLYQMNMYIVSFSVGIIIGIQTGRLF